MLNPLETLYKKDICLSTTSNEETFLWNSEAKVWECPENLEVRFPSYTYA